MIHTDEDDEFDRIAHEAKIKGQPYYFEEHPTDPDKVIFRKPQRDFGWKGLTDEEIMEILDYGKYGSVPQYARNFVDAIEAKLKEKNNG
jgi:hypothetical protein